LPPQSAANFVTLLNALAGTASLFATLYYLAGGAPALLWGAIAPLPFALVFDFIDGRVARRGAGPTRLGAELDSLADFLSFGIAPAALAFAVGMRGGWDALVLLYFVSCGLYRLARFNATAEALADETGKVRYFEGTPIPSTLLLVAVVAALVWSDRVHDNLPLGELDFGPWGFHPLVLLYAASGTAMVSRVRIPKI
jgi:CDP-diacylglycerol--serine O-phosphatidyltransferase